MVNLLPRVSEAIGQLGAAEIFLATYQAGREPIPRLMR